MPSRQPHPSNSSTATPRRSETQKDAITRRILDASTTPIDLEEVTEHREQLLDRIRADVKRIMADQQISQYEFSKRIGQRDNTTIGRILYPGKAVDMRLSTLALVAKGLHKRLEIRFVDEDEA